VCSWVTIFSLNDCDEGLDLDGMSGLGKLCVCLSPTSPSPSLTLTANVLVPLQQYCSLRLLYVAKGTSLSHGHRISYLISSHQDFSSVARRRGLRQSDTWHMHFHPFMLELFLSVLYTILGLQRQRNSLPFSLAWWQLGANNIICTITITHSSTSH
jgi:hypothetical protein